MIEMRRHAKRSASTLVTASTDRDALQARARTFDVAQVLPTATAASDQGMPGCVAAGAARNLRACRTSGPCPRDRRRACRKETPWTSHFARASPWRWPQRSTWPIVGSAQPAKGSPEHIKAAVAKVDGRFIRANAATGRDWPSYGLDYAETRHSRLAKITTDNVKDLGLVWSYDLESTRGVEATPVVVDGVMYVTASWSIVHAIDVRTGKRLWTFDPQVDRSKGYRGCCDVVNRGVAV